MKIINKILAALVALPLVAGLASCSEQEADYSEAAAIAGSEVYFSADLSKTVELSTEEKVAYINLNRVKTTDAINVPLKVTSTSADIKPATSAEFAAGENVAKIAITYDPEKVEPGKYDTITVAIDAQEYVTPYGKSNVTVLVGQAEPWVSIGWGQFCDNFMWEGMFADVKIEQNQIKPNQYRVVDPYKDITKRSARDPYFYFTIHKAGDKITETYSAPFDGFVTYEECNTGEYYGDGYGYYMPMCPYTFTLGRNEAVESLNLVKNYFEDGTPAYISLTSVYGLSDYGGAWDTSKDEDLLQIVMPGYTLTDYSADIEYTGKFVDLENSESAVVNVELGGDVASAKIGIFAGKASNDGLSYVEENGIEIAQSGKYNIPFPENAETGTYTVYVVSFDEEGESQKYGYDQIKYVAPGAAVELTWTPLYLGTWEYSLDAFCNEDGTPKYGENLVLSQCDQDQNLWKISPMWTGAELIFSWDQENNVINFEETFTGADFGYGEVWAVDLTAMGEDFDPGYYDAETGSFMFDIYYADDQYGWGYGFEKFTLTAQYTEAKARAAKARAAKAAKKHFAKKSNGTPIKATGIVKSESNCSVKGGIKRHAFSKKIAR